MIRIQFSELVPRVVVAIILLIGAISTSAFAGDRDGTGGYKYTIYGEEDQFTPVSGRDISLSGASAGDVGARYAVVPAGQRSEAMIVPIKDLWRYLAFVRWLR